MPKDEKPHYMGTMAQQGAYCGKHRVGTVADICPCDEGRMYYSREGGDTYASKLVKATAQKNQFFVVKHIGGTTVEGKGFTNYLEAKVEFDRLNGGGFAASLFDSSFKRLERYSFAFDQGYIAYIKSDLLTTTVFGTKCDKSEFPGLRSDGEAHCYCHSFNDMKKAKFSVIIPTDPKIVENSIEKDAMIPHKCKGNAIYYGVGLVWVKLDPWIKTCTSSIDVAYRQEKGCMCVEED
jgi:hypothetical protein